METRHKEILCLSHDRHMLQIRRMLLEHFGYTVLPAASPEDAMKLAKRHCPDLLLMDNSDSDIDFEQLAEQMKRLCPDMIVAMLSSYYYAVPGHSGQAIDRVVAKDEGPTSLISQIAELFGRTCHQ